MTSVLYVQGEASDILYFKLARFTWLPAGPAEMTKSKGDAVATAATLTAKTMTA